MQTQKKTATDPQAKMVAAALAEHVKSGAQDDGPLWDKHFHPDFVSVEADGSMFEGRAAVQAKCDWWMGAHQVHSITAEGPFVGPTSFAMQYTIDVEPKDGSWPRMTMTEVGVYHLKDGKVVREEFWMQSMPGCEAC